MAKADIELDLVDVKNDKNFVKTGTKTDKNLDKAVTKVVKKLNKAKSFTAKKSAAVTKRVHYGIRCSVINCNSRNDTSDVKLKMYSFPSKPWMQERRQMWIALMRRKNDDGTQWEPNRRSYVCSRHFVGNEKSDHPLSPSYLPSIFPKCYNVKPPSASQITRFARVLKKDKERILEPFLNRLNKKCKTEDTAKLTKPKVKLNPSNRTQPLPKFMDAFSQTDRLILPPDTLADVTRRKEKKVCDRGTSMYVRQSNEDTKTGFFGYSSIKTNKDMVTFAGITLEEFDELFGRISFQKGAKMPKKDRLLLVLHKMKTNVIFGVLAIIFGVSQQTASATFKLVFKELNEKATDFVKRLSQQSDSESPSKVANKGTKKCTKCSKEKIEHYSALDLQPPKTFLF